MFLIQSVSCCSPTTSRKTLAIVNRILYVILSPLSNQLNRHSSKCMCCNWTPRCEVKSMAAHILVEINSVVDWTTQVLWSTCIWSSSVPLSFSPLHLKGKYCHFYSTTFIWQFKLHVFFFIINIFKHNIHEEEIIPPNSIFNQSWNN